MMKNTLKKTTRRDIERRLKTIIDQAVEGLLAENTEDLTYTAGYLVKSVRTLDTRIKRAITQKG